MIFTKKDKRTNLEKEIDQVLVDLSALAPQHKDYLVIMEHLERLYKLKSEDETRSIARKLKPDTLIIVAGNLLGILLILNYEETNIIRTKALSFVLKGRV